MSIIDQILEIVGRYQPVIVTLESGYQRVETNWGYILAFGLLALGVYCTFRLIGAALGGKKR